MRGSTWAITHRPVAVAKLAEAGTIRPVVDRTFPLESAADAHRYLEAGHRRGSVVVTLAETAAAVAGEGGRMEPG